MDGSTKPWALVVALGGMGALIAILVVPRITKHSAVRPDAAIATVTVDAALVDATVDVVATTVDAGVVVHDGDLASRVACTVDDHEPCVDHLLPGLD